VTHRIALLPGDGVGPEVTAVARRAVDALGLPLEWTELPWGSAYWHEHGRMMPADALATIEDHDAVLMGAIGDPSVPDHVSLWGLVLEVRQRLDLWANVRPARLLEGVPCPLAGRGPADVDMLFVRENTEGEYSGVGGRAHHGLPGEVAVESSVFTRQGVERVLRHAFELATGRRGLVTSATKSNASRFGYVLWDELAEEVAAGFPDTRYERVLVDALAARMVRDPGSLDVVVGSNLFGDILTDLAAAIQGGMGMAASANLAPGSGRAGLFEPVHGSAPDIAGHGVANPAGAIWSAVLMLEHLGEAGAARSLMAALEDVCRHGPRTRDLGGDAGTAEVGDAVVARLS
jgi:tartrate dehydrogenase/decarboxylase/D-malate dehydrogenase